MLIGCAALAGLPLLSGWFSKDEIIAASWIESRVLAAMMLLAALLTAYYSFRLYFRVFEGPLVVPPPPPPQAPMIDEQLATDHANHGHAAQDHGHGHDDHAHHDHEPAVMIMPLVLLAIGAVIAGGALVYHHSLADFLGQSPSFSGAYETLQANAPKNRQYPPMHFGQHAVQEDLAKADPDFVRAQDKLHTTVMAASSLIAALGVWFAYLMHLKDRSAAERVAQQHPGVVSALEHKYWFDEIYSNAIVEPLRKLGDLFFAMDRVIVDGIVFLISFAPQASGFALKLTTQRGYLQGYAVTMLFGIAVILLVVFL
jgi:NADH-quinone oxidoreductase subunit L